VAGPDRHRGLRAHHRPSAPVPASRWHLYRSESATVAIDADTLRSWLLDRNARADLFPGFETVLRSGRTAKVVRLGVEDTAVQIALDPTTDGRTKISIAHERLKRFDELEEWKFYWFEWPAAIDTPPDQSGRSVG